ncbi:MAG: LuxR C-terminal-related transcriptional regulator [Propionibacteriaceae bacterium]|nr:LuxR C-terminal-related transcriptional regulator [Propionibacteriaceae bacterium]
MSPDDVDLTVLDLQLSRNFDEQVLQGPAAVEHLTARGYRVCLYTDERRLLVLATCFSSGACGLARKSDSITDNQTAFLQVIKGTPVIPSSMVELAELLAYRDRLPTLTERQSEVLRGRARGITWGALARRLGISTKTAQEHMNAVMLKMMSVLQAAHLSNSATPGDIERALGLAPGDLAAPTC